MAYRFLVFVACILAIGPPAVAADKPTASVVTLYTKNGQERSGQGTGFLIGPNGLIATAYHVVKGATEIEVFTNRGKRAKSIELVAVDPAHDLALLRAKRLRKLPRLELSPEAVEPSDEVRVVGSPRGLPNQILFGRPSSQSGVVSSLQIRSSSGRRLFAEQIEVVPLDVTVYNGMSGAPVLSENDHVVGVLSGSFSEGGGVAWAIPTRHLIALTKFRPDGRRVDRVEVWPALTLMRANWISLKRSYDIPFSAKHIRKLEILENAWRTIEGTWEGDGSFREMVYDEPYSMGRCFVDSTENLVYSVESLDVEEAQIVGTAIMRTVLATTYDDSTLLYKSEVYEDSCYRSVHGDRPSKRISLTLSGELFLTAYSKKRSGNRKLKGVVNVTDCQGHHCVADLFGRTSLGSVELISEEVMKTGGVILRKRQD